MRVDLRFCAELNDFLTPSERYRTVARSSRTAGNVKDAIEACGVPHTEVGAILANGTAVGFDYMLADGDEIVVQPAWDEPAGGAAVRLRPEPLLPMRFVLDAHLGKLARYLRLLGFDALFDPAWADRRLAAISAGEQRILLTRDVGLLKRSIVTFGSYVRATDASRQLIEVVRRYRLAAYATPFRRCMACNGPLASVSKREVESRLPPRTRDTVDGYRRCVDCDRVYWRGSHYRRLKEIVDTACGTVDR